MKILIIDNAAISKRDDGYYVYKSTGEFGAELQQLGNKVEFFQFEKVSSSSISNFNLKENKILYSSSRLYSSKIWTYFIGYLKAMWRIFHSDFIYIFSPNSFSILGIFAILIGKKYGLYVRGQEGIFSMKSKLLYKYATVIFTVSHYFTDSINKMVTTFKCYTIKPMISFSKHDLVEYRTYERTGIFRILFLGRIDKNKGLTELFLALRKLIELDFVGFHLQIVGDGSYLDDLKKMAYEFKIEDKISFLGAYNDLELIKGVYSDSDVYILPTYHEGFPRTLYEAMIFGTPIITTFVGGIPGIMKDGFNCLKIEAKSVDSIVDQLLLLMRDYQTGAKIARNGLETVKSILNMSKLTHAQHLNQILKNDD